MGWVGEWGGVGLDLACMRSVTFLLLLLSALRLSAATTDVLFIGNSYTSANDLPGMLEALALSLGDTLHCVSSTFGGATLAQHAGNAATLDLIAQGGWDFVVLQEQSQLPSFPDGQVAADFFPAVGALVQAIREADGCAVPVLFMTWGRENGDAMNCANWPPVCTYAGMQELLAERYLEAAVAESAWCAPVGLVWSSVFSGAGVDLYAADGSHPSAAGSYLAAAAFYCALLGEDPTSASYDAALPDAALLREAAWNVFVEEPAAWNRVGQVTLHWDGLTPLPSPAVDSLTVAFGAGEVTWVPGTPFEWGVPGVVPVEITLHTACGADVVVADTLEGPALVKDGEAPVWRAYPNPVAGRLTIEAAVEGTVRLIGLGGRTVAATWVDATRTDWPLPSLPAGPYVLEFTTASGRRDALQIQVRP